LTLEQRLEIEKSIFHWLPYKRIYFHINADGTLSPEADCPVRNPAINEFPKGWWTRKLYLLKIVKYFFNFRFSI
jgi:hypothetical protein